MNQRHLIKGSNSRSGVVATTHVCKLLESVTAPRLWLKRSPKDNVRGLRDSLTLRSACEVRLTCSCCQHLRAARGVAPCKHQINLKPKGQCLQASWRRDTTQGPPLS